MKVLIACEFSGRVREAFRKLGHDAWSCDLLPADDGSPCHYQGDVFNALDSRAWDMMIAFPPCTHLAVSGARWFKDKVKEQEDAILFVKRLFNYNVSRVAIENPIGE